MDEIPDEKTVWHVKNILKWNSDDAWCFFRCAIIL